jgi:hypothetical protein
LLAGGQIFLTCRASESACLLLAAIHGLRDRMQHGDDDEENQRTQPTPALASRPANNDPHFWLGSTSLGCCSSSDAPPRAAQSASRSHSGGGSPSGRDSWGRGRGRNTSSAIRKTNQKRPPPPVGLGCCFSSPPKKNAQDLHAWAVGSAQLVGPAGSSSSDSSRVASLRGNPKSAAAAPLPPRHRYTYRLHVYLYLDTGDWRLETWHIARCFSFRL